MALERYVGVEISALSNLIKREVFDGAPASDSRLTNMQGMFLYFLSVRAERGDVFQRDLETLFNIRRSTATGILKLMERDGYIVREAAAGDARLKKIMLTSKAEAVAGAVADDISLLEARLRSGLSPDELDVFFRVVDKLKNNIEYRPEGIAI